MGPSSIRLSPQHLKMPEIIAQLCRLPGAALCLFSVWEFSPCLYLQYLFRGFGEVGGFMNKIGVEMREASVKSEIKKYLVIQNVTRPL